MEILSTVFDSWHERIQSIKVLVIGDLMLDKYLYGQVNRISPEAPVPIVSVQENDTRLGGAANVALNCRSLGAQVYMAGIVGDDAEGAELAALLATHNIDARLVMHDNTRPTTVKTRIASRHQQLLRLDRESNQKLHVAIEHKFIDQTLKFIQIQKPDIVIFEDYDKGCLNPNIIEKVLLHCQNLGCTVTVDPKFNHFFDYKHTTIFKPNISEVKQVVYPLPAHVPLEEELEYYNGKLREQLQPHLLLITLSEKGIYVSDEKSSHIIPAKARKIADVSGAGDTVISAASIVYHMTRDMILAATCSNLAGGMVCEHPGVVPIQLDEWISEVKKHYNLY